MGDRRLGRLAAANILIGLIAVGLSFVPLGDLFGWSSLLPPSGLRDLPIVPLLASVLCQAELLSLWATFSRMPPGVRLAGVIAGAASLEGLLAAKVRAEFVGLGAVTVGVTTTALLLIRALGVRLTRRADPHQTDPNGTLGLRFSIRSLMILTAVVAVLSAGSRALLDAPVRFFLMAALWGICCVAVGLVALWTTLGDGSPTRRAVPLFALSATLGAFFAAAAQAHQAGWFYIILIMLLDSAALLGSLLVVRSAGYRLSRDLAMSQ